MRVRFEINGLALEREAAPGETLLAMLRRAGFWSVKHGCESGDCGACLVLVNGTPRLGCLMPAARAEGQGLRTVESLGNTDALDPLQRAFLDCGAVQCGYCTPAMLLAATALLERDPQPSETAAREALAGVLCRCTGYLKPVEAILAAALAIRGPAAAAAPAAGTAPSGTTPPSGGD
jgi:putative selenate reductase molybdopterin-binding subunit